MPHFISKNMFVYNNDIKHDDFVIKVMLINKRFNNLMLIPIFYNEQVFFIRCIKRAHDFLYKVDKITRPSNLLLIKKVLQFIASKLDVVAHNLNQTQNKHTRGMQLGYLINIDQLATLKPDYIEIGFGSGRHILDLAKKNPQKIVLGFEIHTPSVRQVINAIELYSLKNLFICNFDARLGIQALNTKSVETLFLHFPVPWNKAKHRRVFHRDFLENSFRILKSDGYINLRSDDYEYVLDGIKEAMSADYTHFEILKNKHIDIVSKYEARWSNMKKDIYEMHIFQHDFKQHIQDNLDSTFALPKLDRGLESLGNKKWIQDSIFISIGDVYSTQTSAHENINIANLTFGSFYMPFNTYLILDQNKELHYLKNPLRIHSHIQAHNFLCKILQDAYKEHVQMTSN